MTCRTGRTGTGFCTALAVIADRLRKRTVSLDTKNQYDVDIQEMLPNTLNYPQTVPKPAKPEQKKKNPEKKPVKQKVELREQLNALSKEKRDALKAEFHSAKPSAKIVEKPLTPGEEALFTMWNKSSEEERSLLKGEQTTKEKIEKKRRGDDKYAAPGTAMWVARHFPEDKPEAAIAVLRVWANTKKRQEASEEAIATINALPDQEALAVLEELRRPKRYIRNVRNTNQMDILTVIQTLDDGRSFQVKALLDSGCTGSCMDRKFVAENGINTKRTGTRISVYNADGTLNKGGSITEYVELRMTIKDHTERIQLAVTQLGKTKLFIGHKWLKLHNPTIDWRESKLSFDRCPILCDYLPPLIDIDGDKIFMFDWSGYIRVHSTHAADAAIAQKKEAQTFEEIVPSHYHDFKEVFDKDDFDKLPERRPWDHAIDLTPNFVPVDCKVYPMALSEQGPLDEFIEENLRTGRIRPSKSPMASSFFFIKKKDGKLRPVQDYRKLNDMTIKNKYPLPNIQGLIDKLKDANYFSLMDVQWGFNNVRIKEGDEWKAAFRTNRGLYKPTVMFFGLTNSPATFQNMMNDILKELIDKGVVVVYLDDIMVFTKTLEEHRIVVRRVLEILRENKLYLKPEKCKFEKKETEYLSLIVSGGKVRMDPAKIKAIVDWPTPKNKKELQSFLGFCNYYCRFIEFYSGTAIPLTRLTGKVEWKWETEQAYAFTELKRKLSSKPILAMPKEDGKYRVEADASDFAHGALLSQLQNGKWHPIAFVSHAFTETERNYEIYDKEMMAIMNALSEFRPYLYGARETFKIWSDHKNLGYFRNPRNLNRRQARWVTKLAEYDFTLHHRLGKC